MHDDWAARIEAVWDDDALSDDDRAIERIDAIAAERPVGDPVALFERPARATPQGSRRTPPRCIAPPSTRASTMCTGRRP